MNSKVGGKPIEILLVEDNPGHVGLTKEALQDGKVLNSLHVVEDGMEAVAFLNQRGRYAHVPRAELIVLDLNLPRKDGRDVLAEIKTTGDLKRIPVVVSTTSRSEEDIVKSYDLNANCYITKPVDLAQFIEGWCHRGLLAGRC